MKDKASMLKNILSMVSCVTRAKCMAVRNKTDALKAQLMLTGLTLISKKKHFSIAAISAKITDVFRHHADEADGDGEEDVGGDRVNGKDIVLYSNKMAAATATTKCCRDCSGVQKIDDGDDDKYPDLRHTLFDEEDEQELAELLDDPNSSISAIDMVKNEKEGESFNLEDEIDHVADLFITKFHKRMRLQKLLSFKRHQQMLEGST